MSNRDQIHKLVDSLPEEALEAAGVILRPRQTWTPEPPRDVQQMRTETRKSLEDAMQTHVEQLTRMGVMILPGSGPRANGRAGGVAWENGTEVNFTMLKVQRQGFEIEERFSISEDKSKLRYSHQVEGPRGKKEEFQIEFRTV